MEQMRLAEPKDNEALLSLFHETPIEGDLVIAARRDPDYFRLFELQQGAGECWLYQPADQPLGMGAFFVREGWLDGQKKRVGYLSDLRVSMTGRRAAALFLGYGGLFEGVRERHDCEVFLTTIMASNSMAIRALVERKRKKKNSQPYYHLLQTFSMIAIHFTSRRKVANSGIEVRTATEQDLPAITALLDADHRERIGGYRFDNGELEHRLAKWPGYRLDQIYLAFRDGRLVGCTSVWDPHDVKRFQVLAYRGKMLWIKRGFNLMASVLRYPKLPDVGDVFRSFYLCNTSIKGGDPEVLRALLQQIYADWSGRGYQFFSFTMDDADPLRPAIEGFYTRDLPFHLYAVTSSARPRQDYPRGRTGFELALA